MAVGKKSNLWIYILVGLAIIAGALFWAKQKGWIGKEELTEVSVAKVSVGDITETVSASGKIQPEVEVNISPDVSGEIIELSVEEGDSVIKGQLLCRIRPDNYKSLVERARAALNSSKAAYSQSKAMASQAAARLVRSTAEFARNEKLHAEKVISDADFEQIKSNYEVAKQDVESSNANVEAANFSIKSSEATLKDATENLRKTEIYAPMSGTVSKLSVEKGERVVGTAQMTGTEIMRIADLKEMEVLVDVNENDIVRVRVGDTAEIDVDSYSTTGKKFLGIVTEISNTAKTAVSTEAVTEFEVKVQILRKSYLGMLSKEQRLSPFRPGMTATVDIVSNKKKGITLVPLAAVTTRKVGEDIAKDKEDKKQEGEPEVKNTKLEEADRKKEIEEVVFKFVDGKAVKTKVKTGISDYDNIEILEGVKAGEQVISGPFLLVSKKLKDGQKVKLSEKDKKNTNDSKQDVKVD